MAEAELFVHAAASAELDVDALIRTLTLSAGVALALGVGHAQPDAFQLEEPRAVPVAVAAARLCAVV